MKPIYIFRHIGCEGPGYFAEFLNRHQVPSQLVAIDRGDLVPTTTADMGGLVFMGGPMSVNDPLPWIDAELQLIRQAQQGGLPVLGHCLGGQLIAKALGATIQTNPVKEIGWHDVKQRVKSSPWLAGLPPSFEAFHWHGETFGIPEGAVHLLESQWCRHQAFAVGRMLALQFHVEMNEPMVREWADLYREQLSDTGTSVQSHDAMVSNMEIRIKSLNAAADVLYEQWLSLAVGTAPFT
ncbi:MAG: type 1 glutamine amidotransferase [Gammaproteobacteria bacterium]|jgi:GMP synthase-like glutamine amidotransferase